MNDVNAGDSLSKGDDEGVRTLLSGQLVLALGTGRESRVDFRQSTCR